MGISGYTKKLLRSTKVCVPKPEVIDNLLIDFNGLIHPSSHKVIDKIKEEYTKSEKRYSKNQIEQKIILQVQKDLQYVIDYAKPTRRAFIATDGVAPFAKLHQQRLRRFSVEKSDKSIFDNCAITPGTEFMDKLATRLRTFCQKKFGNLEIILSDVNVPGEGEHKLIDFLRNTPEIKDEVSVIFGLDADLIMLTLGTHLNNLFVFREEQDAELIKKFGNFNFVSVSKIRDYLVSDIQEITNISTMNHNTIVNDYILLCFFGGNDFLPHVPSVEIKCGSLDKLIELYWKFVRETNGIGLTTTLVSGGVVLNMPYFTKFVGKLSELEREHVSENAKISAKRNKYTADDPDAIPYKDPINYTTPGWERRHYTYFFRTEQVDPVEVNTMCHEYLTTIEWILGYYSGHATDYRHYYNHLHTPTMADIYYNLKTRKTPHVFPKRTFCTPIQQLMCVLPPQSASLVPKMYRHLMLSSDSPIIHYYPLISGKCDDYCNAKWQVKPYFLPVEFNEIIEYIN